MDKIFKKIAEELGIRESQVEATVKLIDEHPELKDKVHPITILYSGSLQELYPEVEVGNHWHENILEKLKNDKKRFYMECNDPDCKQKVPFEGFVLRITQDPNIQAFKLKSQKFFEREKKAIDSNEVDTEMLENY